MTFRAFLVFSLFALAVVGCGGEQPASEQAAQTYIVAVNNPLAYFADRLIGEGVEVRTLFPEDIDPAMWVPTVEGALQLQGAALVVLNGAGYEQWLDKVSLAPGRIVITSDTTREQWIELDDQVTHSHGPQGEHAHGNYAFTTWMDMSLARSQAQVLALALRQRWPEHSGQIDTGLEALLADLDALDEEYDKVARELAGRQLIYSHPVYQYFQRRYRLPGASLHWEPDAMPDDKQWEDLRRILGEAPLFVWEGEPGQGIAGKMSSLDVPYVVVDPAANRGDLDWLAIQRANLAGLARQAGSAD
jgi:zinc transport system substrate-binding protein